MTRRKIPEIILLIAVIILSVIAFIAFTGKFNKAGATFTGYTENDKLCSIEPSSSPEPTIIVDEPSVEPTDEVSVTPTDETTPTATPSANTGGTGGSDGRSDGKSDGKSDGLCSKPPCVHPGDAVVPAGPPATGRAL